MDAESELPVATLTCPHCGHRSVEVMPRDHCVFFFECPGCKAMLRPAPGDCCVFCTHSDRFCPPRLTDSGCGC